MKSREIIPFKSSLEGNNLIKQHIIDSKPLMVARHGAVELTYVMKNRGFDLLCSNAGFFPYQEQLGKQFIALYLERSRSIDILSVWNYRHGLFRAEEKIFKQSPSSLLADLESLSPFIFDEPWSEALAGKKVLVIPPFSETIKSQYQKRGNLFSNSKILPEFKSLTVIKAVQSIANTKTSFDTWFEALDNMEKQVSAADFDIALIGCGAYGLPLASHVKSLGKQAIHVGGALQLLFGIKGQRWEQSYDYDKRFYNQYWVRPGADEKPKKFSSVENGCYW